MLGTQTILQHSGAAARISRHGIVAVTTVFLFCLSLGLVFFGFIGYFSRVNLNSDFLKNSHKSIDYVFMTLDQLKNDEQGLSRLREYKAQAEYFYRSADTDARIKIYSSPEFNAYMAALARVTGLLQENRAILDDKYWQKVKAAHVVEYPGIETIDMFGNPAFKDDADPVQAEKTATGVRALMGEFRSSMIKYVVIRGTYMEGNVKNLQSKVDLLDVSIREILKRNPQLASVQEAALYNIKKLDPAEIELLEKQRAILRSYDSAFNGWGSNVLRWPTIVSTLVVTLAAGLLGGLVSFLGSSVSLGPSGRVENVDALNMLALSRRAILSVTAALGIFLFAGSGLLVLTAQSGGGAAAVGSLELSPYFVAFLAFISGFLADDAFSRLTAAGRTIFQTGPQQNNGQPVPQEQAEALAAGPDAGERQG